MSPVPASTLPEKASGLDRVIALYLARLLACLLRAEAAGQTVAPSDIAHMVASAEALVHAFVRMLAAAKLESAGYTHAARAMRDPIEKRDEARPSARAVSGAEFGPTSPASTVDLIARLNVIIANFEQADGVASALARMIICALAYVSPETRRIPVYPRFDAILIVSATYPTKHAPPPWPPPIICTNTLRDCDPTLFLDLGSSAVEKAHAYQQQLSRNAVADPGSRKKQAPPSPVIQSSLEPVPCPPTTDGNGQGKLWDPRLRTRSMHDVASEAWTPAFAGVGGG